MTTVRFEQDHGVGTIVLANPPSNRIGSQFAVDLRAAVHDASLSDSRVLVIRSDGPNFCMGGNVPEWPGKSADWFRTFIAECNSSFHAIEALRIPTVAVVRGGAIGGGFELALACDFLVAAEDATFFAVEIRKTSSLTDRRPLPPRAPRDPRATRSRWSGKKSAIREKTVSRREHCPGEPDNRSRDAVPFRQRPPGAWTPRQ